MKILNIKENNTSVKAVSSITLDELFDMQKEVRNIKIPDSVKELMDTVLCELRRKKIHVSDRKFFGFCDIARAKAFLEGHTEVTSKDLLVLKNYFWNVPEEIETVERVLSDICENPVGTEVKKYTNAATEIMTDLENEFTDPQNLKPYVKFSKELLRIYTAVINIEKPESSEEDKKSIKSGIEALEKLNAKASKLASVKCVSLEEKRRLNV